MHYLEFQYEEDKIYFISHIAHGDENYFNTNCLYLFDFRDPVVKRKEFEKIRDKVLPELMKRFNGECQLKLHPECSVDRVFNVDHVIPLSTNYLNKTLRHMKAKPGKKIEAQSFGSNHQKNLTLACSKCNAFKKHRFLWTLKNNDLPQS